MSNIGSRLKYLRKLNDYTQSELAEKIGVTKTTISQWEKGKTAPKNTNLIALIELFNTTYEWFRLGRAEVQKVMDVDDELINIPFYHSVYAAAGNGYDNDEEDFTYIQIKELPKLVSYKSLICIRASGDSMTPFIQNKSLLIIDTSDQVIKDGKLYVFKQDHSVRLKSFRYTKNGINVCSYNQEYKTEFYTHQDISKMDIIGRVVWYSYVI